MKHSTICKTDVSYSKLHQESERSTWRLILILHVKKLPLKMNWIKPDGHIKINICLQLWSVSFSWTATVCKLKDITKLLAGFWDSSPISSAYNFLHLRLRTLMLLHSERFKMRSSNAGQNASLYRHTTMQPGSLHVWLSGNTDQSFIKLDYISTTTQSTR